MITVTSLTHPTMIVKIRQGLKLAALGKGHEMGGHGNRVYIQNRKGQNIMRIDWKGDGKFVAYGGYDWGRTEVTDIVKEALQRGCSSNRVKPRNLDKDATITPIRKHGELIGYKKRPHAKLFGLFSLLALAYLVLIPVTPAMADRPLTPLESACIKQPHLLVCDWAFGPELTKGNR